MPSLITRPTQGVIINVRRAMRQQLLTVDGLPTSQQWDGLVTFTPPTDGSPWLRETMLRQPGPPMRKSIGTEARMRHTGIYQISLFFPPDQPNDVLDIEAMGEAIRAAFPDSLDLEHGGQLLRCLGCGLGTTVADRSKGGPWLYLPVRVNWQADTFNPI